MSAIAFSPAFPWPVLAAFGTIALAICAASLVARARGALLRLIGFLFLIAILCGPQWRQNTLRPLPDIALILMDHSQSMAIGKRNEMANRALAALRASIASDVTATAIVVGSTDPAAVFQEEGTRTLPPRPFLAPAGIVAGADAARDIGAATAAAIQEAVR